MHSLVARSSLVARPPRSFSGRAQNEKVFVEHNKTGRIEVERHFLNYYAKTPQTVADEAAKKAAERATAKRVAKMAAEKQVKAKQAAAAECKAAATTRRRVLVEAAKAARVSKMEEKASAKARAEAQAEEELEENAAMVRSESRRSVSKHYSQYVLD